MVPNEEQGDISSKVQEAIGEQMDWSGPQKPACVTAEGQLLGVSAKAEACACTGDLCNWELSSLNPGEAPAVDAVGTAT